MRVNAVLSYIFLVLICANAVAQNADITPEPDWVKPAELNIPATVPVNDLSNGTYYLLYDRQVNRVSEESGVYRRYAIQLLNTSAVTDNSQVQIEYDPSYERVQLHTLEILRDGQVIDKSESSRFQTLQRETEQEALIYNGALTLNIIIDDVRVGDVLDYSYTIHGSNPVFDGVFSTSLGTNWSVPVHRAAFSLLWPEGTSLQQRSVNTADQVSSDVSDGVRRYKYSVIDPPVRRVEDDTPDWFEPWGTIYLSEYSRWSEVVDWALPLYEKARLDQAGVADQMATLEVSLLPPKDQVARALFFNQEQIRYLGLEMGTNSHAPSSAAETLERRYGDCKDKTVLLLAMLNRLGVEAYPALVHTETGQTLDEVLPSALAFNHVIVQVRIDGQIYWVDPTRSYQAGALDEIYQPDYGYALVIKEGVDALIKMAGFAPNSAIHIEEVFNLTQGFDQPGTLSVTTRYTGQDGEYQRNRYAQNSLQSISDRYKKYYEEEFGDLEQTQPLQVNENDNGVFVSEEAYKILNPWLLDDEKAQYWQEFYPATLTEYLEVPSAVKRSDPLSISYPLNTRHVIKVKLPDGWKFDSEAFREVNSIFDFKADYSFDETLNELTLDYHLKHLKSFVAPEEFDSYRDNLSKIEEYIGYQIFSTLPEKTFWKKLIANNSLPELLAIFSLFSVFVLYAFSLIAWRITARRQPPHEQLYYPVTLSRFIILSLGSFLFYVCYWFYRNWRYVKGAGSDSVMPVMRGIFAWWWYYPLYRRLLLSSEQHFGENRLFSKPLGILLAFGFAVAWLVSATPWDMLAIPALILCPVLLLPLVNFIRQLNVAAGHETAIRKNSGWRIYHCTLILATGLMYMNYLAVSSHLTATQQVLEGKALWKHHLQFFWDKGLVEAKRSPVMFYSDSMIDFRLDGNGFTDDSVFSYWQVNDQLVIERALFDEIKSIKPVYSENDLENSTVTVTRKDGSDFVLYLDSEGPMDLRFVNILRAYWNDQR